MVTGYLVLKPNDLNSFHVLTLCMAYEVKKIKS